VSFCECIQVSSCQFRNRALVILQLLSSSNVDSSFIDSLKMLVAFSSEEGGIYWEEEKYCRIEI